MSKAKMTMIGMYNYLIQQNTDLFSALVLPSDINKGEFKNALMLRAGEFETLYADPFFEREAIGIWGRKWYRTFKKWIDALNIEYAPLENYDKMEDWTETENIDEDTTENIKRAEDENINQTNEINETENTTNIETENGTESTTGITESTSKTEAESTTENTVSAYNSSVYEPDNKSANNSTTETTDSTETTGNKTLQNQTNGSGTLTNKKTGTNETVRDTDGTEDKKGTRDQDRTYHKTGRAHGNIGVTTSQQMLESELDIAKWNLYDKMGDLFIQELLIPVYI